jgi:AGZA family xanthine/uracil permease-like MFS transporter
MERLFGLTARGTTARTEVLAGVTTFLTMVYIAIVNPGIMAAAGIPQDAAFTATVVAAAVSTLLMGLLANLPIALAPGMGLNAYFAFVVVGAMGIPWQTALGAVFVSGVLFFVVSVLRIREWLIQAIPLSLKLGIAAGIGFFLGIIGLQGMGVVVANPATMVTLGDLSKPSTLLACAGFLLIAGLTARGVTGAVVIGILATALAGIPLGLTNIQGIVALPPSLAPTFLAMDIPGALGLGVLGVVFTFFVVDVLDNAGTLIATTHRAGLMDAQGRVPRLREALIADSAGAMLGASLGTSTTTSYIESASGIQAGGRTGLTALVVAALFGLTLFLAPLATSIPGFATAPALVFVACLMAGALRALDWDDATEYLPAIVIVLAMPLTFSIATGIGLGFIVHALVKTMAGRAGQVSAAVWVVAAASVAKFALA